MAQRTRGRTAWAGALAVICGGLTGCFNTDKKPISPPQAKGTAPYQTSVMVQDPKTGQLVQQNPGGPNSSPYAPPGNSSIANTQGAYPQGYKPQGPTYDPMLQPNAMAQGGTGVPARPTSTGQFNTNSYPGNQFTPPSVSPAGGAYQPQQGYGQGAMAPPSMGSVQQAGGVPFSTGTAAQSQYGRPDPRMSPPTLGDPGPVPPGPPPSSYAPSVAPYSPAGTPPSMAPISPGGSPPYGR